MNPDLASDAANSALGWRSSAETKGWDSACAQACPWIIAVCALFSLNPYWLWNTPWYLLAASVVTLLVAAVLASQYQLWPHRFELAGIVLLTAFVVYISALPKVDGGHIRWVVVCPTIWALALMPLQLRVRTLRIFAGLFALTVVPAILLSLYLVTGLPITLEAMPYANSLMAAQGTQYVMIPGALIVESNSVTLFWGGILGRIAGIYDEPNTVGTTAALIVAALHCNLRDWRVIIALVAGILSFSLAFVILASLAFFLTAIVSRCTAKALAAIPAILSGAVLFAADHFAAAPGTPTRVLVKQPVPTEQRKGIQRETPRPSSAADSSPPLAAPGPQQAPAPRQAAPGPRQAAPESIQAAPAKPPAQYIARGAALRPHKLDSRTNPSMDALIAQYWASDWTRKLFGLGTDASLVYGSVASTVHRLYTDYGLVGLALFGSSLGALSLGFWRRSGRSPTVLLFLTLFALSIYQRPVVWMPYAVLLLFGGASSIVPRPVRSLD